MSSNLIAQNEGRRLETLMHQELDLISDKCESRDSKIVRIFGSQANGTDHYIEIGDNIILIQDKWEKNTPKLDSIRHFIGSCEHIEGSSSKKLLLAIFASKNKMSKTGLDILQNQNSKYKRDVFFTLDNKESIEELTIQVRNFIERVVSAPDESSEVWELFPHQRKVVDVFSSNFLKEKTTSGIVNHPTGTGKTVSALAMIGEFWKRYPTKSVLWITERKDVLRSQFEDPKKLNTCIRSGFLTDTFNLEVWYNGGGKIKELNNLLYNSNKPILFIVNIDAILTRKKYEEILKDKFGLIILDECHSVSAQCTYSMLTYFLNDWKSLNSLIGFSATPVRRKMEQYEKAARIFGDGRLIHFLDRMSIIDAVDNKIIVPPKFYWIETTLEKEIKFDNFMNHATEVHFLSMISHIENILSESYSKKAISWASTISNSNEWKRILEHCQLDVDKFPTLSKFKIFISHTGGKDELELFKCYQGPCLIICVGRCKEGFDDPKIDVGINLDAVKSRGMISFIQQTGRTLRNYKDKKRGIMLETFTFLSEEAKVKQISELITGYCIFLEQFDSRTTNFNKDKKYKELTERIKHKGKTSTIPTPINKIPIEFNIISTSLKSLDWDKLPRSIISEIRRKIYGRELKYQDAKQIIRNSRSLVLNKSGYRKRVCSLIDDLGDLPEKPDEFFGDKFVDWIDYLGIEGDFYDLRTCRDKVYQYQEADENIRNLYPKLSIICEKLCILDCKFPPPEMWEDYYKVGSLKEIITEIEDDS